MDATVRSAYERGESIAIVSPTEKSTLRSLDRYTELLGLEPEDWSIIPPAVPDSGQSWALKIHRGKCQ